MPCHRFVFRIYEQHYKRDTPSPATPNELLSSDDLSLAQKEEERHQKHTTNLNTARESCGMKIIPGNTEVNESL